MHMYMALSAYSISLDIRYIPYLIIRFIIEMLKQIV